MICGDSSVVERPVQPEDGGSIPTSPLQPFVIPTTLAKANDFIENHHRHNGRTARNGGKFAIGLSTEDDPLCGVAIVGNPLSATLMDGRTAEVLRLCVSEDAPRNSCSLLYGACWRIWREMGGLRLVTYTLQSESGASLRGSGWTLVATLAGHEKWERRRTGNPVQRQSQEIYKAPKYRWEKHA